MALFAVAVVAPLVRERGHATWDTIWIEDSVYVEEANAAGPFAVLLRGYAGYLQLVCRVLAVPTAWIPASWLATYLAVAASLVAAGLAAFAYRSTGGLIASVPLRLVVAAMVVLSPAMAIETTANITNLIWVVLAVAPFAFLSVRDGRADVAARAAVAFLVATSTVLSVLFVPFAVGYALVRRSRASIVVASAYGAGLVLQLAVVRVSPVAERADSSLRILADLFGLRVLGSFLVGERPLDPLWTSVGELAAVAFVVITVVLFALLLRGAGPRNQRLAAVLLTYAVVAFVVPALGRGTANIGFDLGVYSLNMTRYTVSSVVALTAALAVLVDPALEPRRRALAPSAPTVALVWAAVVLLVGFSYPTVRGAGPSWREESARVFAEACGGEPSDRVVAVTTTPTTFEVRLTCERLAP